MVTSFWIDGRGVEVATLPTDRNAENQFVVLKESNPVGRDVTERTVRLELERPPPLRIIAELPAVLESHVEGKFKPNILPALAIAF